MDKRVETNYSILSMFYVYDGVYKAKTKPEKYLNLFSALAWAFFRRVLLPAQDMGFFSRGAGLHLGIKTTELLLGFYKVYCFRFFTQLVCLPVTSK